MIAYYKLLDYLNRQGISKEQFRKMIDIAPSTMAKISKNEPVSLNVIDRICKELKCQPGDILEYFETAFDNVAQEDVDIAILREPLEVEDRDIIDIKAKENK